MKANTSTTHEWLAERLCMGHPAAMSQLVSRTRKDPKIQKILKKHEKTFKSKDPIHGGRLANHRTSPPIVSLREPTPETEGQKQDKC
jgi:hypothetical protein